MLTRRGYTVRWASEGRRDASRRRAEEVGLVDAGTVARARSCDLAMSVCPPDSALDVDRKVAAEDAGFRGLHLDANAIAPDTARLVASAIEDAGGDDVGGGITATPASGGSVDDSS